MKRTEYLPWLAGLVAFAAPAYLLRFSIAGIPTTALEVLMYLFVALVVFAQWDKFKLPQKQVRIPILLFLVAAVISTVIAPDKRVALGILKAWIFAPMLYVWALYQLTDRRTTIVATITGLVAGALTVAAIAVVQRYMGSVTVDGRVAGPYAWFPAENASPNYVSLFLAPIAVLLAGIGIGSLQSGRKQGWQSIVGAMLLLVAIYFSFSRGGIAAAMIGLASLGVWHFWPRVIANKALQVLLVVIVIAGILGGWQLVKPDPSLSPDEGGRITASNNVRWEIWKTTAQEIIPASPLLGIGLGNYQQAFTDRTHGRVNYDRIAPLALTPHNFFLALWTNLGLLGLISAVWLLAIVFRHSLVTISHSKDSFASWINASVLAALTTLLIHGLLDTPYFKNDLALLFWILVTLLLMLQNQPWNQTNSPSNRA